MSAFIDERRQDFGVELICRTLGVSASAYYARKGGERSARDIEDERLWGTSASSTPPWYVGWFNTSRLHEALGDLPPAEFEALCAARYVPTPSLS